MELSSQAQRFIEALCFAEMIALGYPPTIAADDIPSILLDGPGEEVLHRPLLTRFDWSDVRRAEELDRRARLQSPTPDFRPEAFLFNDAYVQLREVTL